MTEKSLCIDCKNRIVLEHRFCNEEVTSVLIGARTVEQLADNLKTAQWEMTPDEVTRLDGMSKPPSIYPHWIQELHGRLSSP